MNRRLRRYYFWLLLPAIILIFAVEILKEIFIADGQELIIVSHPVGISIFIICAVLGLGFPILYRAYFAHANRTKSAVSFSIFLRYQKNLLIITLSAVYVAVFGYSLNIPEFYKYTCVLIALYAAYYYYPSDRRLSLDRRIFRVKDKEG